MAADSRALARQRPPIPADTEYDSICAAVMETVRGRWFLAEYSRRNRHADTQIILGAIDRIETALRTKTPVSGAEQLRAELAEALLLIDAARGAIDEAQAASKASADVQLSLTTMRELADVMRQKGVDSLYCTQLEARIAALSAALAPPQLPEPRTQLAELLEQLHGRVQGMLASLGGAETSEAAAPAAAATVTPEPAAPRPNLSVVTSTPAVEEPAATAPVNASGEAATAQEPPVMVTEPMKPAVLLDLGTPERPPAPAAFTPPLEPFVPSIPAAEADAPPAPVAPPGDIVLAPAAFQRPAPEAGESAPQDNPADAPPSPSVAFAPFEFARLGTVDFAVPPPVEASLEAAAVTRREPLLTPAPPADPLAAILALSDEERIALFS